MDIDDADVIAEVSAAFTAYEAALVAGDHDRVNEWFWDDPRVVRFGIADIQYGYAAIAAWRRQSRPVGSDRALHHTAVTALGRNAAVVSTEFDNPDVPTVGRQTQVWARFPNGWLIVHAHVSTVASPTRNAT